MTLNDKIIKLLNKDNVWQANEFSPPDFSEEEAANEIEKLIIQEKIDLIDSLDIDTVGNLIKSIVSKRNELLGKLNTL